LRFLSAPPRALPLNPFHDLKRTAVKQHDSCGRAAISGREHQKSQNRVDVIRYDITSSADKLDALKTATREDP
jgi:hypothetical protein